MFDIVQDEPVYYLKVNLQLRNNCMNYLQVFKSN